MFWQRARRVYGDIPATDPDIQRYLAVSSQLQSEGYQGLVGFIQDLGHRWISARTSSGPILEIGFGSGRHARFFRGAAREYFVSEYSPWHLQAPAWQEARGRGVRCDARRLPYTAAAFRTVISIYNLEHIEDLSTVLREVHRVLQANGQFLVALPCEGGLCWNLGRELTTRRHFQRAYGINYDKAIAFEHKWDYPGVVRHVTESGLFTIAQRRLFPLWAPTHHLNLIACLRCTRIN